MVDAMLRGILGDYGEIVLDFYLENGLVINAILLFYAIIVSFSYRSYRSALTVLLNHLQENYAEKMQKKTTKELVYLLGKIDLPWQEALDAFRFPLIAQPRKLLPKVKNMETLKELISISVLADQLKTILEVETNDD